MLKDNIISIDKLSKIKGITIREAADILNMSYASARRKILYSGEIGFFDYDGMIKADENDVRRYKANHYRMRKEG